MENTLPIYGGDREQVRAAAVKVCRVIENHNIWIAVTSWFRSLQEDLLFFLHALYL